MFKNVRFYMYDLVRKGKFLDQKSQNVIFTGRLECIKTIRCTKGFSLEIGQTCFWYQSNRDDIVFVHKNKDSF